MIDDRYDDAEWAEIRSSVPKGVVIDDELLRQTLDQAAVRYCQARRTRGSMEVAAMQGRRKKWADIEKTAQKLRGQLSDVGEWYTPIWGDDDMAASSNEARRVGAIEDVQRIVETARLNLLDYGDHAKSFQRQQDPDREDLYECIFRIWTNLLSQGLTTSHSGPLWRFFNASVSPLLGKGAPRPSSFKDIAEREQARRNDGQTKFANDINSVGFAEQNK